MANLKDINYGIGKYLEVSDASDIPDIGTNQTNINLLNFKVATNNAYALYNFKDGMIDDFQDTSGVDASASTNEIRDSSSKYYSGIILTDDSPTGGTTSTYGSTKVNTFLTDANFVVTSSGNVDMLIVGGGGGGADEGNDYHRPGGGGGAGGMRAITGIAVTAQTYAIDVGDGGAGGNETTGAAGANGSNSTALGYTATGGGKGGFYGGGGSSGGSGGGGAQNQGGGSGNSGSYSPVEGYNGASGSVPPGYPSGWSTAGGGGGAGEVGTSYLSGDTGQYPTGGAGGDGLENNYRTGSNVFYAGGGGGGGFYGNHGGGGQGGGGGVADAAGTANTGGGGAGAGGHPSHNGAAGGSGIVVIKYPDDEFVSSTAVNLTLVSNTQTANAEPDEGRLMIYEETSTGSTTLDTDLKGYVSRDGGTTYTQTPLTLDTTYATGKRLVSGSVDISGQPAGTSMRYKIETLNQSALKVCRIHGASLLWA